MSIKITRNGVTEHDAKIRTKKYEETRARRALVLKLKREDPSLTWADIARYLNVPRHKIVDMFRKPKGTMRGNTLRPREIYEQGEDERS